MCIKECNCPSGYDGGDDDNGYQWDVKAQSLQAGLQGLTDQC